MWEPQPPATLRASTACYTDNFTYFLLTLLSSVGVTTDSGSDSMIGFIAPYTFAARDYRQYSVISILRTH
jgi:hypothetical protein